MRTIATIALKGGSGKTTVAAHLALAAHLRGLKTVVVDTDPQRSATQVLQARAAAGPLCVTTAGEGVFAAQIAAVGSGMDAMIIDTAAGAVEDVTQAIVVADLTVLVVRPTLIDIAATVRSVDIIRRLRRPATIVVNQAPVARDGVEPPSVARALRALGLLRIAVTPVLLRSRTAYQAALETGRSVEEGFDVNAKQEMTALWSHVGRLVFGQRVAETTFGDDDEQARLFAGD